ncbi:MAG TPA: DUF1294 domain-containing protein [Arcobacter sp.]|nr:DUF1294 domain-containing protein [Arcobacter sp.]HIP56274.1 DUF1294 domain-containing protein [Arcobacter sp.]
MINFSFTLSYFEIYIIVISCFSFVYYSYDKLQSFKKGKYINRVSEINLLFSSFIGGSIGSIFAMIIFRHKIKKYSFVLKFVLILCMQFILYNIVRNM